MGTTIIGRRDFLKKSVTIGTALTLPSIMTKGNKLSGTDHTELVKSTDASGSRHLSCHITVYLVQEQRLSKFPVLVLESWG